MGQESLSLKIHIFLSSSLEELKQPEVQKSPPPPIQTWKCVQQVMVVVGKSSINEKIGKNILASNDAADIVQC